MKLHTHHTPRSNFQWTTVGVAIACGCLLTACHPKAQPPAAPMPEVTTITVVEQPATLTTELPGRTSPYRIAEIRPQVNGLILKRLFTEGTDVKQGQELYQVDPAPFQAAVDNARAALGRAEAQLPAIQSRAARYKQALADKAVSQQDFDDADAALKQSQADVNYYKAMLDAALINLGYARIVSPISGRIGSSTVTDGAIVTAYQPVALATIQQLDPIYVDVPQSTVELQRLRQRIKEGQLKNDGELTSKVKIILENGTHYKPEGTLQFRDISVDPTTGSVTLRMVFPNPDGILLPGMFVRTIVTEGINEHAMLIPQQSVFRDPKGNPQVYVVDASGKVVQRPLVLDRTVGDQWLVASGLAPGEKVITEGTQKVAVGVQVKQSPPQQSSSNSTNTAAAAQPSAQSH